MFISIVIPARNEAENIEKTVKNLKKELDSIPHETLIVNDHSRDNTVGKVLELKNQYPSVKLINNNQNPGFASTLWTGFRAASGEGVVVVMADACDDPKTIPEMTDRFLQGYDLVCGSRYIRGGGKDRGPKLQGLFSFLVNKFAHIFLRIPTTDASNAFKLYRREALLSMRTEEKGFALSMELAIKFWRNGYRIIDIPTIWKGRAAGKSKFKLGRAFISYGRQILRSITYLEK